VHADVTRLGAIPWSRAADMDAARAEIQIIDKSIGMMMVPVVVVVRGSFEFQDGALLAGLYMK
jgi:hypothetical protein